MRKGTYIRFIALKNFLKAVIKNNSVIIDIGGYDGTISSYLKDHFNQIDITVIDTNERGLEISRKKGLNTLNASATDLSSISDRTIDYVLCFDVIEHIKKDEKLISEISRVLKENGKIFLTTPRQNGVIIPLIQKEKNLRLNKSWGHIKIGYSILELNKLFQNNGLRIIENYIIFNFFSKIAYYWVDRFFFIPIRFREKIFKIIVHFEPYIEYGGDEHLIVGRKVEI